MPTCSIGTAALICAARHEEIRKSQGAGEVPDQKRQWLRYVHQGLLIVCNLGPQARQVPLPHGEWKLQLRSDESGQSAAVQMPAQSTFVYASGSTA